MQFMSANVSKDKNFIWTKSLYEFYEFGFQTSPAPPPYITVMTKYATSCTACSRDMSCKKKIWIRKKVTVNELCISAHVTWTHRTSI